MLTSSVAEDVTTQEGVDTSLQGLYKQTMEEIRSMNTKNHSLFHIRLWGSIAPSGNIYRLNALIAERLKHTDDLWEQLREIAEAKRDLPGMPGKPDLAASKEELADALFQALKETKVRNCPASDSEQSRIETGFRPLEEFLGTKAEKCGPPWFIWDALLMHADEDERNQYKKNLFVSFVIMAVQFIAPLLIFVNQWNSETNFLTDGHLRNKLQLRELLCMADTVQEALTMVMGVLFLILVFIIVRSYVDSEMDNLEKQSKLCLSRWWTFPNASVNAWCCTMTCLILPLLFWSELRPTDIVLDALGLLFIFTLDDLAGDALGYLETDDTDFQRMAVWHTAMLYQCPVHLSHLINPQATSTKDIWKIHYDSAGHLLNVEDKVCVTRLSNATSASENTPITEGRRLVYYKSRTEQREFGQVSYLGIWTSVKVLLQVLQILVPPAWLILSQPCYGPGAGT